MSGSRLTTVLLGMVFVLSGCKFRQPDDKAIVAQIQAKFFQNPKLKLRDIHVESRQGAVTLTGTVKSISEGSAAERLSREVSGVVGVLNSLELPGQQHAGGTTGQVTPPPTPPSGGDAGNSPPAGGDVSGGNSSSTSSGSNGGTVAGSTNAIDQYLARKPSTSNSSPLFGQGSTFESYGQQYVIDPRLIVAISGAETSFATSKCHKTPVTGTHNAWNWFWCYGKGTCGADVCLNSPFDTWDSGIHTVSKYLRKNYLNKGYNTIPLIRSKYCVDGCEHWVPNVTRFYEEMNGDPHDLAFHAHG